MGDIIHFIEKAEDMSIGNIEICILQTLPNGKLVFGLKQPGIIDKGSFLTAGHNFGNIIKMN